MSYLERPSNVAEAPFVPLAISFFSPDGNFQAIDDNHAQIAKCYKAAKEEVALFRKQVIERRYVSPYTVNNALNVLKEAALAGLTVQDSLSAKQAWIGTRYAINMRAKICGRQGLPIGAKHGKKDREMAKVIASTLNHMISETALSAAKYLVRNISGMDKDAVAIRATARAFLKQQTALVL